MKPVSVNEASVRLGVNRSRVRALIDAGELDALKVGGRWLVDEGSLAHHEQAVRVAGRPFEPRNAWALLLAASGEPAPWSSPSERWRFRRLLSSQGLSGLVYRLRRRAEPKAFVSHPGELAYLRSRSDIVASGISAARSHGFDLNAGNELDGYVRAVDLSGLAKEHALLPAEGEEANIRLRAVPDDAWFFAPGSSAPFAAVAVDLAESFDPRSARVGWQGLRAIDRRLKANN